MSNLAHNSAIDPQSAIVTALKQVLRPLVRLMLARNINFSAIAELLKQVMVEVAVRDFKIAGKPQTDSRISLLTGVHRKDVRRLRNEPTDVDEIIPSSVSLGTQLLAIWTTTAPYLTRGGHPKPLPRLASAGGALSFEGLVESVSKDIRSRAVLDELMRLGVVNVNDDDHVILDTEAFVPKGDTAEKAFYFGHNLHDHAAAATHNMLGERPPFFERSVHYSELSQSSIAELRKLSDSIGMQAIKAVNRRALELERTDAKGPEQKRRFTYGIYFYSELSEQKGADGAEVIRRTKGAKPARRPCATRD